MQKDESKGNQKHKRPAKKPRKTKQARQVTNETDLPQEHRTIATKNKQKKKIKGKKNKRKEVGKYDVHTPWHP